MTGLATTSKVLQNEISGLPSYIKGKHPDVLGKVNLAKAEQDSRGNKGRHMDNLP
jgi:hypothetical protein